MPRVTIDKRVETLELRMGELESLPTRMAAVEGQILQLRDEMHGEFSAVRKEMHALHDDVISQLATTDGRIGKRLVELHTEMHTLNEKTNVHMRVLHEDVMAKLATMAEGRSTRRKNR